MLASVRRKPMQVCTVSMVPAYSGGLSSITQDENCGESATPAAPQTRASPPTSSGSPPKESPSRTMQTPLVASAATASVVRPMRSATKPPPKAASPPAAIDPKVTRLA